VKSPAPELVWSGASLPRSPSWVALLLALVASGCDHGSAHHPEIPVVDFRSEGATVARLEACGAEFGSGAHVGSALDRSSAPTLWSVSPYMVLLPADGVGHVTLNVDAPHFDWLLFTDADVLLESLEGPEATSNGILDGCAEPRLAEYGAHHHERIYWPLRLTGEPGTRVHLYAALSATPHSDPSLAGHAGHDDGADGHEH